MDVQVYAWSMLVAHRPYGGGAPVYWATIRDDTVMFGKVVSFCVDM